MHRKRHVRLETFTERAFGTFRLGHFSNCANLRWSTIVCHALPYEQKKRDRGAADLVQLVLASERVGGCVWELFGNLLWKQLTDE
jgi:hypothetical protein